VMTTATWVAVMFLSLIRPSDLIGKWVHHGSWQEIPGDGPTPQKTWSAGAIVLRFCPDGTFLRVHGVLYRSWHHTELGSSDGLEIWRGTWRLRESGVETRVRLIDAEISFTGMQEAMRLDTVALGRIRNGDLDLAFTSGKRTFTTLFSRAKGLPSALSDRFLSCKASNAGRNDEPE
jgi:hypothetical protein